MTYGQNESIRDFVDRFGGDATWCCFTDLDEYVFSPSNRDLRADLDELRYAGGAKLILHQKKFRDRHDVAGLVTQCFDCLDVDFSRQGPTSSKQIVLLGAYKGTRNIHEIRVFGTERTAPLDEWRFNHYNANASGGPASAPRRRVDAASARTRIVRGRRRLSVGRSSPG